MAANGDYLRCPQCHLRIRASVWEIFGDQPGDCPRCTGMRSESVPLEWEPASAGRGRSPASERKTLLRRPRRAEPKRPSDVDRLLDVPPLGLGGRALGARPGPGAGYRRAISVRTVVRVRSAGA